jgi:hypothetical protein
MSKCSDEEVPFELLITRYDFIVGLQKFNGPASYPMNQGIFRGLFWDLALLVALINLRRYAWFTGSWKYIKNSDNIQTEPKFVLDNQQNE